ncbi:Z-ring associated protein ZapG [Vibrio pectenicida]|uniref:Z-ring associated protein G n=1 Tax=Vibrio pectenicida TaxID=62763 RepID=A0A3R9FQV2_9VIBR|nr:Z-ring associated protein ZapG [Vibrio pectenicida]RSD32250.1 DUF1043 family protein [Vibrio pectenicida]
MLWIYALVGLLIGAVLGIIISRITTPGYKKQKAIQKDLESAKFELEQQKQDLSDHFAQAADMLDSLGKEYTKLYQHMAKTSAELLPNLPEQDNPFSKKVAEQIDVPVEESNGKTSAMSEAPKDYASGSTGLLKEEKKQQLNTDQAIAAEAS